MDDLVITSAANPRLKALAALRRRRAREEQGTTLVEGWEELRLALHAGVVPRVLYHCPDLMADAAAQRGLVEQVATLGGEVVRLGRSAFEKVSYREGPDGFIAVVDSVTCSCAELTVPDRALVLVCEAVEKPGNLGAILRTADAAGVHAVIAADPVTDWGNPNLVRASKATVFSVPVAADSTAATLCWLQENAIPLVAASPDPEAGHPPVDYTQVDYTGPVAIAVGAEKHGLSASMLAAAWARVQIPMSGRVNSLNVATSAAVIAYEAVRQRRRR